MEIPIMFADPRPGDPPVLVADSTYAKSALGWEPVYPELESIVESAYKWMKLHPHGYLASNKESALLGIADKY